MQLRVKGARAAIALDSTLDGFAAVVRRGVDAAAANGLRPGEATTTNLQALGIRWPEAGE